MKRIIMLSAIVLSLCPVVAGAFQEGFARISLIEGEALIRTEESTEWLPAAVNTPLYEGDSIWSPEGSRVEVHLQNDSRIRLDGKSSLDLLVVDQDLQQFHLGMGYAYVQAGESSGLQLEVNDSSIKVQGKATLRVDLTEQGHEEIALIRGSAVVEGTGGLTRLRTGEMLTVEVDARRLAPLKPWDDWEHWNRDRDRALQNAKGRSPHLPDELQTYAQDFDAHGDWVTDREYGSVWRPAVVRTHVGWSPYQVGRWVWRGGDYVWVTYESWGWAPYHYGRWVTRPGWGWCWVPPARFDVFWSPGYVGWVSTPTYIGWVALAPGETYYGRRHYGRHSAISTSLTINTSVTIYRNVKVRNAVAVVERNAFTAGRSKPVKVNGNVFRSRNATFGPPAVAPAAREARMPAVREIHRTKLPPPAVARASTRELRERRYVRQNETIRPAPEPVTGNPGVMSGERGRGGSGATVVPAPSARRLPQAEREHAAERPDSRAGQQQAPVPARGGLPGRSGSKQSKPSDAMPPAREQKIQERPEVSPRLHPQSAKPPEPEEAASRVKPDGQPGSGTAVVSPGTERAQGISGRRSKPGRERALQQAPVPAREDQPSPPEVKPPAAASRVPERKLPGKPVVPPVRPQEVVKQPEPGDVRPAQVKNKPAGEPAEGSDRRNENDSRGRGR